MPAKPKTDSRSPSPSSSGKSSAARAQQVRIIGGQWKRTPLPVLNLDGLRPTPDRVRETVFNWLTHLFDGLWEKVDCLDMFAGSGALGFEAASRGAANVVLLESAAPACQQLQANKEKLKAGQITIVRGDALLQAARLLKSAQRFDLIFLDPPYQSSLLQPSLAAAQALLKPGGLLYMEMPRQQQPDELLAQWEICRNDQAGMIDYYLLKAKIAG